MTSPIPDNTATTTTTSTHETTTEKSTSHQTTHNNNAVLNPNAMAEVSMSLTTSVSASHYIANDNSLSYQPQRLNLATHRNVVVASSFVNNNDDDYNGSGTNHKNDDHSTTYDKDGDQFLARHQKQSMKNYQNKIHGNVVPSASDGNNSVKNNHPENNNSGNNNNSFIPLSSLPETSIQFLNCHPDWELVKRIGGGGFGEVWTGFRRGDPDKTLFAIKIANSARGTTKELNHEIELLLLMPSHPHIVQPLHYCSFLGGTQLVMEYCRGGSLQDFLDEHGAMSEDRVREYTRQILLGLSFLHRSSLLHRDIKPHNVLLADENGTIVKLVDFGLSSLFERNSGMIGGSARYMCPEAFTNPTAVTGATDLWALGATIVNLLTNEKPWADRFGNNNNNNNNNNNSNNLPTENPIGTNNTNDEENNKNHNHHQQQKTNRQNMNNNNNNNNNNAIGFWQLRSLIISLPLDEKERANHHPTIPDFVSDDCKAFLKQIFNIDPFRRGTAQALLSHPWILKAPAWNYYSSSSSSNHNNNNNHTAAPLLSLSDSASSSVLSSSQSPSSPQRRGGQQHQNNFNNNDDELSTSATMDRNISSSCIPLISAAAGIVSASALDQSLNTVFEKTSSSHVLFSSHNNNNNNHQQQKISSSGVNQNTNTNTTSNNNNNQLQPSASSSSLVNSVSLPSDALNTQLLESAVKHVEEKPGDPRLWSFVGRLLPSDETVLIKGKAYTRAQCMYKSCLIEPNRLLWWNVLGRELLYPIVYSLGPTTVAKRERSPLDGSEIEVDAVDCFVRCLEIDPLSAVGWRNLGLALSSPFISVKVAGKEYDKLACYLRSTTIDPSQARSWSNLGNCLKPSETILVNGETFTKLECYTKACLLDPSSSAWGNLGNLLRSGESVKIGDRKFSKLECQIFAVTFAPSAPQSWNNLAVSMGSIGSVNGALPTVTVAGKEVTRVQCLYTALLLEPANPNRWKALGLAMEKDGIDTLNFDSVSQNGNVVTVTSKNCFEKAVCLEPENATRWTDLANSMNDDEDGNNTEVAYIRPILQQQGGTTNSPPPASPLAKKGGSTSILTSNSSSSMTNLADLHQNQGSPSSASSPNMKNSNATTIINNNEHQTSSPTSSTAAGAANFGSNNSILQQQQSSLLSSASATEIQDQVFTENSSENDFVPMNKIQLLTHAVSLNPMDANTMYVLANLLSKPIPRKKMTYAGGLKDFLAQQKEKEQEKEQQQQERQNDDDKDRNEEKEKHKITNDENDDDDDDFEPRSVIINGNKMTARDLSKRVIEICSIFYRKVDDHCQSQIMNHERLYQDEKGHVLLPHKTKTWRCDYCRGRDDIVGALSCRTCDIDICSKCFDMYLKNGSVIVSTLLGSHFERDDGSSSSSHREGEQNNNVQSATNGEGSNFHGYKDEY